MTLYWHHYESQPQFVGTATIEAAKARVWHQLDPVTRARYLRALCILTLQAAALTNAPKRNLGDLQGSYYANDERTAIGSTLARTLIYLAPQRDILIERSVETVEGIPLGLPDPEGEAGALPALAIVAIVTVCAAAATAISSNIAEVIDSENFLSAKTQTDVALHGKAVELVASHNDKEAAHGKIIPYSPEELRVLRNLEHRQREVAQERRQRLPTPFDGAKEFVDSTSDAIVKTANDAIVPIALVAGAAVLLK